MPTVPKTIAARSFPTQQGAYIRKKITFQGADQGLPQGVYKIGRLPANAFVESIRGYVSQAFNAGTTNTISIGTTANNANEIVAAGQIDPSSIGLKSAAAVAGGGAAVTLNQEVDVYLKYGQSGTPPTAGFIDIVMNFAMDNDG